MYLPDSIKNLTKLEYLDINNKLSKLTESIGDLSGLKYDIDAFENSFNELLISVSNLSVKILY